MNDTVETTGGRLRGIQAGRVRAFLGIPYAAPPLPPHRFMAPRPPAPWAGVREAGQFGPQALQLLFPFLDPALRDDPTHAATHDYHRGVETTPLPYAEDCLALNVWTPATTGRRPVMVWLHGGGFHAGAGSWGWSTGEDIGANQDVVVVTLNHRLNIFGFLCLAEHAARGYATNAGMLDIVMALQWVRDNIAAFGGDPGNVTIFGQSGGGMKVTTLTAMPAARGLFHKAIVQSGPFPRAVPMDRAHDVAARALAHLGIAPANLEALQTIGTDALLAAFRDAREGAPGVPRQYAPVVDGDTLPCHPFEPAASPTSAGIPMLIGATSEEINSLQGFNDPSIYAIAEADLPRRVAAACDIDIAATTPLIAAYREARPHETPSRLYAAIASDRRFGFGSIVQAERQATHAPVFAYRLTWQSPVQNGRMGAAHNLDMPLVFGRDKAPGITGETTAHHALAAATQTAWAHFARTGNPNHPGLPEWPRYNPTTRPTMILDTTCHITNDPDPAQRRAQAALPARQ